MKVLVTGGSGWIGSAVVADLMDEYEITVFDVTEPRTEACKYVEGNILRPDSLTRAMNGTDAVIHLAGGHQSADPHEIMRLNALGSFNVLEGLARSTTTRLIAASSDSAFGLVFRKCHFCPEAFPVNEGMTPRPQDPYGLAKLAAENMCRGYAEGYGIRSICLRHCWVWGTNGPMGNAYLKREEIAGKGDDGTERWVNVGRLWGYIDISDVVRAYRLALERIDEVKHEIDWMVKRRLNQIRFVMNYSWSVGAIRERSQMVGPTSPADFRTPRKRYGRDYSWIWDDAFHCDLAKEVFAYARQHGIQVIYHISAQSNSMRRQGAEWVRTNLKKMIDLYGTDHLYSYVPHCEKAGLAHSEKLRDGIDCFRVIQEVDPEATWVMDTWDLLHSKWTADQVVELMSYMPRRCIIHAINCDTHDEWLKYGYFAGREWSFGILRGYAGHVWPHGDIPRLAERMQRVARDPMAARCMGACLLPESCHHSTLYFHAATDLMFAPESFVLDSFLRRFAVRRYGSAASAHMVRALDAWQQEMALYQWRITGPGIGRPLHIRLGARKGKRAELFFRDQERLRRVEQAIPLLRFALEEALENFGLFRVG